MTTARFFFFVLLALHLDAAVPMFASNNSGQNWIEVSSPHFSVISNAGAKEGARVAAQFEQIRAVFQTAFPHIRADSGKPTIIFALKNEDSLKLFLPSYGLNNKEKHLAGLYHPGTSKNYALVRTDITGSGANPYHSLYHEYTHSLLRVNFRGLPLWLEEGLAEFYGNTAVEGKQVILGMADPIQLRILQRTPMIPIETLFTADSGSPLYNAQEHSGIFYAESWAIVHYLVLSTDVRSKDLLNRFMSALRATDDPTEAAHQSFGDLKQMENKLRGYTQQVAFQAMRMPLETTYSEKDLKARALEPAEALSAQADFLLSTGKRDAALDVLHKAETLNPNLAAIHEGLGDYHYQNSAFDEAEKEFNAALQSNPDDWIAFFFKAHILLKKSGYTGETVPQIRTYLEKTIALVPDFAPAHAFLCIADLESPETKSKAIFEAKRATELEPGNLAYFIDLGKALLANGMVEEAKLVAERAQKSASTGHERAMAVNFARKLSRNEKESDGDAALDVGAADDQYQAKITSVEGQITELICGHPPQVMLTVTNPTSQVLLHVKDISAIKMELQGTSHDKVLTCAEWMNRRVKVTFSEMGKADPGEIQSINFE